MPSPYLKTLAKETGKSEDELEKYWDKAKEISSEFFGVPESQFGDREYKYATGIIKNELGIKEHILDVSHFLDSRLSAREFIEQGGVISGDFNIGEPGGIIPPSVKKKPYSDEEKDFPKEEEIEVPMLGNPAEQ